MRIFVFALFLSFCCTYLDAQELTVKKGDILVVNGVRGIVFSVDESGCHGTMMSVKAFRAKGRTFCTKPSLLKNISMSSTTDGKANTEELFSYVAENNIELSRFPVFNWCRSLGQGWYIPSIEELKVFVNYWLGNDDLEVDWGDEEDMAIEDDGVAHTKKVNEMIMDAGGIPFLNGVFSSTLSDEKKVSLFEYNKEKGEWYFSAQRVSWVDEFTNGRAFYDF